MPAAKTLLVALLSFGLVANIGLFVLERSLRAEKEQLLQEQARLVTALARVRAETARLEAAAQVDPDADPSLIPEEYSIAVVHVRPGCGEVAFYRKPGPQGVSALARLPNGRKPVTNSPILCGHCGRAGWPLYERARVLPPR